MVDAFICTVHLMYCKYVHTLTIFSLLLVLLGELADHATPLWLASGPLNQ